MAKPKSIKRKQAKAKHEIGKRRNKAMRLINRCGIHLEDRPSRFNTMLSELTKLNLKCLQVILADLNIGLIHPWYGEYHRQLVHAVELNILERTMLK